MDVTQIESLLEKVGIIKKKYDDLAEYTGENYNVFNILRLSEKELIHSAFIANLLNVKGEHGQKDIFLRLFLDEIKELFTNNEQNKEVLEKFETSRSSVEEEVHLGSINYDSVEGGRVDIVLKDGSNQIVIENKIGAGDQYMQLSRYNTHFFKAPIIYLTLSGGEPSDSSRGKLKNGVDFICVSYRQNITNWIEKCIKEMANKPIIRETLNQYLFLVKQLTNQTTNDKMEEEIIKLIINNKESVKTILEAHNTLDIELKKKIGQIYDFFQTSRFKEELENKIKGASFSGDLRVRLWAYPELFILSSFWRLKVIF